MTSLDGKTLYYTTDGNVWSIPADDGTPNKICAGDGVAVDLNGKDVFVNLFGSKGTELFRIPLSGDPGKEIRIPADLPMNNLPISGSAVRPDGKVLLGVQTRDSCSIAWQSLTPGARRSRQCR